MKEKSPTLAVIMPVAAYNVEWVVPAIESTDLFPHEEFIVIADEGIQFHPALLDPRITQLIMIKEQGVARALNAGISQMESDYFSVLCSDDAYTWGMRRMIEEMHVHHADIIGGKVIQSSSHGHVFWPEDGNLENLAKVNHIASGSLVRRDLWWKVKGFKDKRYCDWYFWVEAMIMHKASYRFVPVTFYNYRMWEGGGNARTGYDSTLGFDWKEGEQRL